MTQPAEKRAEPETAEAIYRRMGENLADIVALKTERDRLKAANAELVKSTAALLLLVGATGDRKKDFEASAAAFHRETGKMAPGKDQPTAGPDIAATPEEFHAWGQKKIEAAKAVLAKQESTP